MKITTKKQRKYWHVTLSKGEFSSYREEHLFFYAYSSEKVWQKLCKYIDETDRKKEFECDRHNMYYDNRYHKSPYHKGDFSEYDVWSVKIENLPVIYFK